MKRLVFHLFVITGLTNEQVVRVQLETLLVCDLRLHVLVCLYGVDEHCLGFPSLRI